MTTVQLPQRWATNVNYSSGPDSGTPTCVDPGSADNGFVRGVVAAPQHVNFELQQVASASRRAIAIAATHLRVLGAEGLTIDDTGESMAAISLGQGQATLAIKVNSAGVLRVSDSSRVRLGGALASVTSLVSDAATDGTRIVVIGTGGNRNCFSDDNGENWSAGGVLGGGFTHLVWNEVHSRFICGNSGANTTRYSADAATWSAGGALTGATSSGGIGVLSTGDMIAAALVGGDVAFYTSSDGGDNWSVTAGTVANVASLADLGWLVGNVGDYAWHVGRIVASSTLQVSRSADGASWTTLAELVHPGGPAISWAARPRIYCCQNSGLLAVLGTDDNALGWLYCSLDGGQTWTEPAHVADPDVDAVSVAGGKVFFTHNESLYATDGIGWE